MNRHDTLKVFIEDGVLVMQIGVEALKFVIAADPHLTEYNEKTGEWVAPKVTDIDEFAKGVLSALLDESEDGSTPVHLMLDAAIIEAIEQGTEGVRVFESD